MPGLLRDASDSVSRRLPSKVRRTPRPDPSASGSTPGKTAGRWASLEAPRLLAAIVEHSNDAIFSRTLDGTIISWNAAAERMFGFSADEVIGHRTGFLLPRGRRDEFRGLVNRLRRGAVIQHFETERRRKAGDRIHVSLTLSPLRDSAGRLVGFSTIARDITERKRVLLALERRDRELTDLFEESSIGLLLTTATGQVLRANPTLASTLGYTPESLVGRSLLEFHPDREAMSELLARLAGRATVRNLQTALRARAGQMRDVLVDASALWEASRIVHCRWFIRDITRRKELEREVLAIAERERRAFSRELHDSLGQQLSGIAYLNNVVRDRLRELGSPEAQEVSRISTLLKGALEATRRVARGLSPVRPEPEGLVVSLSELAAHARQVFGVACRLRCPRPVPAENFEAATNLYRIAQEAVNNAVRHGRASRIVISLFHVDKHLALHITDNGQGIKPLSPKRKGLGLRIMHYRASLLHGTLSVHRQPTGGTQVACLVPASSLATPPRQAR